MTNKTLDKQLVGETGRWLAGMRNPDVRAECREHIEEWLSEEECDDENIRIAWRFWRNLVKGKRR